MARLLWALWLIGVAPGCAMLTLAHPEAHAGTLTTADGAPVAGAEVVVDTWSVWIGSMRGQRLNTTTTRTDRDGRWAVQARPSIQFAIAMPDALPMSEDEITFRAPGQTDLHLLSPPRPNRPDAASPSTMRADASGPTPLGAVVLPVVGGAFGAGQVLSAHAGGMLVVSRDRAGVGARAAAEIGARAIGGDAGILIIPARAMTPNLGVELNARAIRHWRADLDARVESGPEIGVDLVGYRLTIAWLGPEIGAAPGRRRWTVGFGFGFF